MKIDRIELADCGSPERLLIAIFKQIPDMPIPVPIEDIATEVGIDDIRTIEADGFEGALITNSAKSRGAIVTNKKSRKERRRFTIGHETGHFLIPTHRPQSADGFRCFRKDFSEESYDGSDRYLKMEAEANRFAAGLLIPAKNFRSDMRRYRDAELDHIFELAERYQASKDAIARKYVEQHDRPCCAIISRNGRILRVYKPKEFPFISSFAGHMLPPGSLSASYGFELSTSSVQAREPCVWFDNAPRVKEVYEQVCTQINGFRLSLISIEQVDSEDDEEQSLAESYKPRFHR